jgi:hypothetical protein
VCSTSDISSTGLTATNATPVASYQLQIHGFILVGTLAWGFAGVADFAEGLETTAAVLALDKDAAVGLLRLSSETLELSAFLRSGCGDGALRALASEAALGAYSPVEGVFAIGFADGVLGRVEGAGIFGIGGAGIFSLGVFC